MKVENIGISFGINEILKDVSFEVKEGEHLFLVGPNGAGKTTLLKAIMGETPLDSGKITINKNEEISYLPQVINDDVFPLDKTVYDYLLSARDVTAIKNEINSLYEEISLYPSKEKVLLKKVSNLLNRLEYLEEDKIEDILLQIIEGMNIDISVLDKKLGELSGGQKSKIAFARTLFAKNSILLLDEPTNHLDKETKEFVMNYLKNYKGTILCISHDTEFLNEVCTSILYIDKNQKNISKYNCTYKEFLRLKEEKEKAILREKEKQDEVIKKYEAIINKYKTSSGKRKKMAMDREKKLEKILMDKIEAPSKVKEINMKIEKAKEENKVPLEVNDLCFKYSTEEYIIDHISFSLYKGEKFLVVGENGIGKSTLLKLITNRLSPNEGTIKIGNKIDIAYYAQEFEMLNEEETILENFRDTSLTPNEIRSVLGKFLFYGDDVYKKVKVLSPGEKARCTLAKIYVSKANFLVLDEPTNHLDIETQKEIALAFKNYNGTMLIVSHNTDFVENLGVERMLLLPEGRIYFYDKKVIDFYKELNTEK